MWNTLYLWLNSHPEFIAWGVGISALTFVGSLIAVPLVVVNMSPDFFLRSKRKLTTLSPMRLMAKLAKNGLGLVLLLMGVVMLFLPGQGLLTLLLGVSLIDFPGKRKLEIKLVRLPRVHHSIDWIRQRAGKAPLHIPDSHRA